MEDRIRYICERAKHRGHMQLFDKIPSGGRGRKKLGIRFPDGECWSASQVVCGLVAGMVTKADYEILCQTWGKNVEHNMKVESERDGLRKALEASSTALDDWINTFAPEFCDDERVKEARKRIRDTGGTLSYVTTIREANRQALNAQS